MSEIKVSVVSSNEEIYSGEAKMVYATGSLGELGIAPGHTLINRPSAGSVRLETENGEETSFCSGGFIEIQPNEVTFLADTAERADSLDEAEAIKAQELAQKELSDRDADMDFTKAAAQLAEAAARIKTIQKLRKNK